MIADEMVTYLLKEFWCFDTYTECGKEFTDRMAVKNALKHCYLILTTDAVREHYEYDFKDDKLGVDDDYWESVKARLEKLLDEIKD